jgi:hypothetical protein
LLCLSICLFPSFSGPWTHHSAISFLVFLFILLHTAFRTTSFLGLRRLVFFLYGWRQHIPPKCWYLYTELQGVTFQNNAVHFCGCPTHLACIECDIYVYQTHFSTEMVAY